MGFLDDVRDSVSNAVDSVTGGGSSSDDDNDSDSSSGGGQSIAERTADAGNDSTSGSESTNNDDDSGRSVAERTADAGNSSTSGSESSTSSDNNGRSIADRTRDAGNSPTSGKDPQSSSEGSSDSSNDRDTRADPDRPSVPFGAGAGLAAQGAARANEFVEDTRSLGTSADPLSTPVEDQTREFFGDPGAGLREFGTGVEARIDRRRPEVDFSDGRDQIRRLLDPREELTADDDLQQALNEAEEVDDETIGGPAPGFELVAPAGRIRGFVQAARGAPRVASTASRSGPTGSQIAQSVGRQGQFAAEGAEQLIRAAGIGTGVAAIGQTEIEAPTENQPLDESELNAPTEQQPADEGEIEAPTSNQPVDQPEIEAPTSNQPVDQPEIEAPTSDPSGRPTEVDVPTIDAAELIGRQTEIEDEDDIEEDDSSGFSGPINEREIVVPEELIPDDTVVVGDLPEESSESDQEDLDSSMTVERRSFEENTDDSVEVDESEFESSDTTPEIDTFDEPGIESTGPGSSSSDPLGSFDDLDSDVDRGSGVGVGTGTGTGTGLGLGGPVDQITNIEELLGVDQPVDFDQDIGVDLDLDQPEDTDTTTTARTRTSTRAETGTVETTAVEQTDVDAPTIRDFAGSNGSNQRRRFGGDVESDDVDIELDSVDFDEDEIEFDTQMFDEVDEALTDFETDLEGL